MDEVADCSNEIPVEAQSADDVNLPTDAAERKRVLNILAQRRYRRRRKERQNTLESLFKDLGKPEKAVQAEAQEQGPHKINDDPTNLTSNSTPSSDGSGVLIPLTWPDPSESIWDPGAFDFGIDTSSDDTSHSSPEAALPGLNELLQSDDILNANFADDFHIAVPELDLLRAAFENAGRIQSSQLLFDLNANSVFLTSDCSGWLATLPKNLQPTTAQLTVPHHPIIDILPWPSVRNKLINMYNMPTEFWPRHPDDGTESGLLRLVYDMEDGGIRVTGPDPSNECSWEVEQKMFKAWWWCLDQKVVEMSNAKRASRGLPRLSPA